MLLKEQHLLNESSLSEFLLLEFSDLRELQILHFIAFLLYYLAAVAGNVLIISAVASDHHLNTPMYFFLMNLAILDLGQVSVIYPKAMTNSLLNTRRISYSGCVAQVLLLFFFLSSNLFLLTVMAYDRYVSICNSLHYEMLMNKQACIQMVTAVWISSTLYAVLHTGGTFAPPFCSNVVNQFFCEVPHLLKLACSELYLIEIGVIFFCSFIALGCGDLRTHLHCRAENPLCAGKAESFLNLPSPPHCCLCICLNWIFCLPQASLKFPIPSGFGIYHDIYHGPPLMNPVIYSMRNKEIKHALSKLLDLRYSSRNILSSHCLI